jgi:hypothetical protein
MKTCKHCGKEIKDFDRKVVLQESVWVEQGQIWEGMVQGYKEVVIDGGIFCGKQCLSEYLEGLKEGGC